MLVRYLRDEAHRPYGVVVATGRDKVSWSLCNPKDHFDRDLGKMIARGRAEAGYGLHDAVENFPQADLGRAVEDGYRRMVIRAEKYYKEDEA